jgi:hypothetical protein
MIKATGLAALTLAAALFMFLGDATQAAPTSADTTASSNEDGASKPTRHRRHYAHRRSSSKTAQKSSDDKADKSEKDTSSAAVNNAVPASSAMPPSVANANARLAAADTPTAAAATAMTSRANENLLAAGDDTVPASGPDNKVVASDQLNDVDRALQQDNPSAQKTVLAAVDAQPRPGPGVAASSGESSTWDQTSLIGKIFIGFGALLTVASAARMFMA